MREPSPQHLSPRLLTRDQAADYCGLSPAGLSTWIKAGRIPPAIQGTARWDLKALDAAIDTLSGINPTETSALDNWRSKRAR